MSSGRYRDLGSKDSADSRRRQFLGQRSKTMIEESSTSRYHANEDSVSPGLGRRYGSARYHRTTLDFPIRAPSSVSSHQGSNVTVPSSPHSRYHSSSAEPSSPRNKYQSSSTNTSGISSQPFRFTRTSSFDTAKSSRTPVHHDFSSHQTDSDKNRKYTSGGRQSPSSGSKSSSSYKPKYSSINVKSKDSKISTSPPLHHYHKDIEMLSSHHDANKDEESSSRSSSISSRGSSGSASRKSSTGSLGRDRSTFIGSYSGRTSPEVSTSRDISRLSQKIAKTFQGNTRRGSEGSASPPVNTSPFFRSYSLRSDYTSRYAKHQLERTKSGPAKTSLKKQSSLPEETEKKEDIDQRSRKGSWLQSQGKSPNSPEKGGIGKIFGKQRSDSASPSESPRKFSFSSKLSSSNESNTDSGGIFRKKFSIPSKYFSSKETISRESSEGSSEILDSTGTGKLKKKYSLPTKLNFKKRSASIERAASKSEPASPDRFQEILRGRSTSLDTDPEKDLARGSLMRRLKFWDKKERHSPHSRSISPEGRELMSDPPVEPQQEEKAQEKNISTEKENKPDELVKSALISDGTKSLERTRTSKSPSETESVTECMTVGQIIKTTIEVASKMIEKQASTETETPGDSQTRKTSREQRRARYRRGQNIGYSKSMDAAVDLTPVNNENDIDDITEDSEMQTSDKLRERRRLRRLEREKFFASASSDRTESIDSVKPSRQKLKLSVSTEDTGMEKQRSQTIASPAHKDIIESILREKPHLSRKDVQPPSVKEMLKRFICEDDSSKTLLESRRTKGEGRPHTICGGILSPDEMRKFEDINFSLARQYSSDESHTVKSCNKGVSSSSDVGQENGKIPAEAKVESSPAPSPSSFKAEGDSDPQQRSLFRKHKHATEQEDKEKEKKREKELEKEKEKEKKSREKEEKERKEREKQKEKSRKEEKDEKARKEEKEDRTRKEKEEKLRKEKEEKLRKEKEEKLRKEREKQKLHKDEKEKLKEDEKEKKEQKQKEKKEKEQKERLKDKEKREVEKKGKRDRKHKLREEQKEKTQQQLMQAIEKRAQETKQAEEVMSVDGVDKDNKNQDPPECEFPREGSVSALLGVFSKPQQMEKPRHPMRFHKVRPRTLAAGIAPEIIKTARDMMERREKFHASCQTQDDSSINNRRDSMGEEPDRLIEYKPTGDSNQDNRLAEQDEEDRKKELRRLHKAKKAKKATRPFGMMKTKSESNLDKPFELIHVEIDLDERKGTQETKQQSKFIELTPVAKQIIPPVKITLDKKADEAETKRVRTTSLDDGLEDFFGDSKNAEEKRTISSSLKIDITTADLDAISSQTTQYLRSAGEDKMHIKPKRRHTTKSNPVKALQERQDVRTDTEAPRTPRIEKKAVTSEHPVIRRKKKKYKDPDNLWRRHTLDLAASAIAGLASTEDFTKVTLRKTVGPEKAKEQDDYRGTKPIMLIHIKGRRNMQTRLIEPCQKSLNSGDCFVLVTKDDLFAWVGKDANAIERAKVTEIASRIFTKRELDCKVRDITFVEERDKDPEKLKAAKKFWKILGADPDAEIRAADCIPADEEYEKGMTKTNMVYKVHWTEPPSLIPVDSMCGRLPQVSILDTKEVLVFDFGSELYVWNGQQSLSGQRKTVFALGKQLFESPFEPSGIYNPLYPYGKRVDISTTTNDNKITPGRPPWALLGRLHEKAETILFREKFLDWPDPTKIIKMKGHPSSGELIIRKHIPVELKPCDPKAMLAGPEPLKGETFEGVNVGRGHGVPTRWTGDYYKEGNLCTTVGLTVWHINEYRHYELPSTNIGHFHSGEGYVIRWAYYVMNDRIAIDRKSRCRSTIAGRVRTAYYFWQGNDCTVNEKGAAAVMAVELDQERGPQVRVVQGKEPPSFLNHFKGTMVIHAGNASKCWFDVDTKTHVSETIERLSDSSIIRLYCLRNEESTEGYLVQVKATCPSLRSRGCFVLLVCREGQVYVWYGCKTTDGLKKNILIAAKSIHQRKPLECNVENEPCLSISEVEEGNEPDAFFKALGGKKYYCSLLKDPSPQHFTPRLFELSSATGKFLSNEILCPSRVDGRVCSFPFLQEDLYGVPQPALFLLDFHYEVYVWEGWIPENDIDSLTGTGKQRWDMDRKLAMETAVKYAEEAGKRISHRVYVVYAGLEPMSFKVAFPCWAERGYITSMQKETGKQPGARNLVTELLDQFTKETYSLEELQQNPPPQGVDPAKLETYLNKEDFSNIFKTNIEEFHKLPGWKQHNLKKAVGLF